MVAKDFLFILCTFVLIGCQGENNPVENNQKINLNTKTEESIMTNDEYDKEYFEYIRNWISENDFLKISEYVIKKAKENNFQDIDPILGKKK